MSKKIEKNGKKIKNNRKNQKIEEKNLKKKKKVRVLRCMYKKNYCRNRHKQQKIANLTAVLLEMATPGLP